jgi:hypothetical protein
MTKTDLKAFSKALTSRRAELGNERANRNALTIQTSADELDRIQEAGNRDWAMSNLERSCNQLSGGGSRHSAHGRRHLRNLHQLRGDHQPEAPLRNPLGFVLYLLPAGRG